MSYILEALRKSEQERNPEKVPDLSTHHRHVAIQEKKSFPYWILGVVLVLINVAILFYLFNKEPEVTVDNTPLVIEKTNVEKVDSKPEITPKMSNQQEPVVESDVNSEPEVVEVIPEYIAPITPAVSTPKTILDSASVPNISELSYDLQLQIPNMDFSTHIYVRDGGSFIIINGKSLSEGMIVDRGIRLVKILSDGIILEFKNRKFFMTSMTSWVQS